MASSPPPGRPGRGQMFGEGDDRVVDKEAVLVDNVAREAATEK